MASHKAFHLSLSDQQYRQYCKLRTLMSNTIKNNAQVEKTRFFLNTVIFSFMDYYPQKKEAIFYFKHRSYINPPNFQLKFHSMDQLTFDSIVNYKRTSHAHLDAFILNIMPNHTS